MYNNNYKTISDNPTHIHFHIHKTLSAPASPGHSHLATDARSYLREYIGGREQQLAITAYVTRMGIMGNLLPD